MRKFRVGVAFALYLVGLVVLLVWAADHGFREKIDTQKTDRNVIVAADYEDIIYFRLDSIPVDTLMVPDRLPVPLEAVLRKKDVTLVWKLGDDLDWADFSQRFQPGDGLVIVGDDLFNRPYFPTAMAELVRARKGFVVMAEFSPVKSSRAFFQSVPSNSLIKGHIIGTRETSVAKPAIWRARVQRAASERWVRFFCVRFSAAWSAEKNFDFQKLILQDFLRDGFQVSKTLSPNKFFQDTGMSTKTRSLVILFVSVLTPVFIVLLMRTFPLKSALLAFFLYSAFSVFSGVVIHSLGATPSMVLGISPLRGVKLQLILPLIFALYFLLSKNERGAFMDSSVRVKHLVWGGVGAGLLLFLYLSRSGNHPLIEVTQGERGLRDAMEVFFGARPRFKEFLFAHPLFVLGLLHFRKEFMKGRFFVWLGLIGQISILNTFTHFHAPLELGLLRSFHGCWLGAIVALPFCALYSKITRS